MATDRFKQVERIFERALEMPAGERASFLDEACGGDDALRKQVEQLLAADSEAGEFLQEPAVEHGLDLLGQQGAGRAPEEIGPYRVIRKIGQGGMSEVYLAVRADEAYQKRVAIKLVRQDLDRDDLLRRFRMETQILAGLDHPNIATLLDGGTTEDGVPYFVMEYIEGVPVDEYCDRNSLTVKERIELFRTICSAVHYAHQNLVVHRDIKASNILVTADGTPKLLDFGIAKLLRPDQFAGQAEYTATWVRPMTPRYASPEQVQGKLVGTPSDVYSLGVLLYKLLTGHLPYRLDGRTEHDLGDVIVAQDPERPSTAISRMVPATPTDPSTSQLTPEAVSRARRTQPQTLQRQLSGDLDNIVLMALRKEPQRRYGSVEQFAEDLRRYLGGMPVVARKDTLGYRTGKFVRRNFVACAAAAMVVLLLAGFAVSMGLLAQRVAHERDQANAERDRSNQVVRFMIEDIFQIPDPYEARGGNITATEILDRGAEKVSEELDDQPEVQATLMNAIGSVYRNLGMMDRAEPMLERSLEVWRETKGDGHHRVAAGLQNLGTLRGQMGNLDESERMLREALEMQRQLEAVDEWDLFATLNSLAVVTRKKGNLEEAKALFREALALPPEMIDDDRARSDALNNLAIVQVDASELEAAEENFRAALKLVREAVEPGHPQIARFLTNLGTCLGKQEKYEEAEPYLSEALTMLRENLPPRHPAMIEPLNNLGKLKYRLHDTEGAEPLFREALDIVSEKVSPAHPHVGILRGNLADVLRRAGDLDQAEIEARRGLDVLENALGKEHIETGSANQRLAYILLRKGDPVSAERLVRQALEIYINGFGEENWNVSGSRSLLGECLLDQDRFDEAEPLLVDGFEKIRDARGLENSNTQTALKRVVRLYDELGRAADADRYRALTTE